MPLQFALSPDTLIAMFVSLFCGAVIGLEREYRNKSTGLRTIILITLGSTVFTLASHQGSGSDDRVAANIITGIGFIGAGVIFKDKMGVLGLTTAAVIWVAAGIGMTAGFGNHGLALAITGIVLAVLMLFGRLEGWINTLPQNLLLTVTLVHTSPAGLRRLESEIRQRGLKCKRLGITKGEGSIHVALELRGPARVIAGLQEYLLELDEVTGFY